MTVSAKIFQTELYQEHLEEASFLYEQRLVLIHDPELTWLDLADYEARLETHLDGLFLGEELALDVCRTQALEGDFGELFAAVCIFFRHNRFDLLEEVLPELDLEDEERARAFGDALIRACPPGQVAALVALAQEDDVLAPILVRVLGWRRLTDFPDFLEACRSKDETGLILARAYGRLANPVAITWLDGFCLRQGEDALAARAAVALLRLGEMRVLERLRADFSQPWVFLPLGLGGTAGDARILLASAQTSGLAEPEGFLALGLLGEIAAVEVLLAALDGDAAEFAAMGLELITGAGLFEEVFIPEPFDEDELFPEESEAVKRGEPVKNPNGRPAGENVIRPSRNPDTWRQWWQAHGNQFQEGHPYRNGQPYSPAGLLENMRAEKSPNRIRELAHHELLIRYGLDLPFELDMPIPQQRRTLERYAALIEENGDRFEPGTRYFHGKKMA